MTDYKPRGGWFSRRRSGNDYPPFPSDLVKVMLRIGGGVFHVTLGGRGGAVGAGEIIKPHGVAEHSLPGFE
jgi:hypothetical protein